MPQTDFATMVGSLLIVLDSVAAILSIAFGLTVLAAWWHTGKVSKRVLGAALVYLTISGRIQSGIYIRAVSFYGNGTGRDNVVWQAIAVVAGVALIVALTFEFFQMTKKDRNGPSNNPS